MTGRDTTQLGEKHSASNGEVDRIFICKHVPVFRGTVHASMKQLYSLINGHAVLVGITSILCLLRKVDIGVPHSVFQLSAGV